MYELNRIRLVDIGPAGARYDDVTIDLSGVGTPAGDGDLFSDAPRRPSPYTLLMLENGGGKSVLLKLIFSVVLPGRRRTVGRTSLDDYVLEGDTGHVILEWMHVGTGARLLTGKVAQRRARTAAASNPLAEGWYTLRPTPTVTLETLPVVAQGRRVRLDGYRTALADLQRATPAAEVTWCGEDQKTWVATLGAVGIDSELFDIQRRMNLDEGDAADAFTFTTSKMFIDWLLTTVTDRAEVRSMADTFLEYATTVADRGAMVAERDFLEGAIIGLEPLAEAHGAATDAERAARVAQRAAHHLHRALVARLDQEQAAAAELIEQVEAAGRDVTARNTARDNARDLANEVRLQTLLLRAKRTDHARAEVKTALTAAELEVAGWALLPDLARTRELAARAERLAAQVAAADADAAPALARRDTTAGLLLAKLDAAAADADSLAGRHDTDAGDALREADDASAAHTRATNATTAATKDKETAAATVTAATRALNEASAAGHLPARCTLGDVAAVRAAAETQHTDAKGGLASARGALTAAGAAAKTAERDAKTAASTAATADHLARAAREDHQRACAAASRVAGLAPVLAAADTHEPLDPQALDGAADTLLTILGADVDAHDVTLDGLRDARAQDDRLLAGLGEGGLLPARLDVERILSVLSKASITAHSGWRYLAEVAPAADRPGLINAHPDLADGVVLPDQDQLPRAREVLAAAELLPSAAVRVAGGASLLSDAPTPAAGFVVAPSPAMFDATAAEARRVELDAHRGTLETQIRELGSARSSTAAAVTALEGWRQQYPADALVGMATAAQDREAQHQQARTRARELEELAGDATEKVTAAQRGVDESRDHERATWDRLTLLSNLETQVGHAIQAATRSGEADVEIRRAQLDAAAASEAVIRANARARGLAVTAERVRTQARAHRTTAAAVPCTSQTRAAHVPAESLAALQADAAAAHLAYESVATDADLRTAAERAAKEHRDARAELSRRDGGELGAAERLLAGDAGADPALWEAGARAARERAAALRLRAQELAVEEGTHAEAIRAARPATARSWTSLDAEWQPTSIDQGEVLGRAAEDRVAIALREVEAATLTYQQLSTAQGAASAAATAFDGAAGPLRGALRTHPDPDPGAPAEAYRHPVGAVHGEVEDALNALASTGQLAGERRAQVQEAASQLLRFAREIRFEALSSPARSSILGLTDTELAARAGEFAAHLGGRLASLTADLENSDRFRALLVERLANLVDQGLKTVRQAQKLSELPAELGDWGRRPFLSIRFAGPDLAAIAVHVTAVIDDAAETVGGRSDTTRATSPGRDGMDLLLAGVHAAVPKGFVVTVLKPDSVLREERVEISEMTKVFSGGQQLTAAIVLYCTLAALRANERGRVRAKHSGVLFLDNPIGKASATYLLALQQAVAASLGVQLVYTTGLSDDRVLAQFPLWVRLRNDADARANLKHISVAQTVRNHLPGPVGDGEHPGTVTAARVYRRLSPAGSTPWSAS